jgi:hypothetical protein
MKRSFSFLDEMNHILEESLSISPSGYYRTYTTGNVYDPSTHDLIPKPDYIDSEIRRVDQELESNDRAHESSSKYYEGVKVKLLAEKEKLQSLKKKK